MIIDAIFSGISAVLSAVFSALPSISLASALTPVSSYGVTLGRYLSIGNGFMPLDTIATMLHDTYVVLLPAIVLYKAANWIWRHIPDLWGFGPGSG